MGKPAEIPQDIWDNASLVVEATYGMGGGLQLSHAKAIAYLVAAERERCAVIAEANAHAECEVAEQIAAAIRAGR